MARKLIRSRIQLSESERSALEEKGDPFRVLFGLAFE
jgi:hypothetical protein